MSVTAADWLSEAAAAVDEAEALLRRPSAQALEQAARTLEAALPGLRAAERALREDPRAPGVRGRAALAAEGEALKRRIGTLGLLLEAAARFHEAWAAEAASRRGYSAAGAPAPLAVAGGAGWRCSVRG